MLSAIFFYFKQLPNDFTHIFSHLHHSLMEQNITPYILVSNNESNMDSLSISFSFFPDNNAVLEQELNTLLSRYTLSKEDVLFISDHAKFLTRLKDLNYYTIGYASNDSFLPSPYVFESFKDLNYAYFVHIWQRYRKEPITILTTRHLLIRELAPCNLPTLYALYNDKENLCFMEPEEKDYDAFYEKLSAYIDKVYPFYDFGLWGVFLKETGELIGEFGIQPSIICDREEIELGYLLSRKHQKKGYAKEAIRAIFRYAKKQLACDRIVAKIHKDNKASIATAIACGMQFEKKLSPPDEQYLLYVIYVQQNHFTSHKTQHELVTRQIYDHYQEHPDNSVYGKRYRNKQK